MSERATWRSEALGPAGEIEVAGGRIRAHVTGEGPAIVFLHGLLVNANLWRKVVARLEGFTCVTLDLPLGAHVEPVPQMDVSIPALARAVDAAVRELGLRDATLVGNDSGGALAQIVAAERPDWLGRLVLTSCDAFEVFPPRFFQFVLAPARIPALVPLLFGALRLRSLRRLPIAFGWLAREPIEPRASDSYVLPVLTRAGIRRDLARVLRDFDPRHTQAAAEQLRAFDRPALIAFSREDRFFAPLAPRLAAAIPDARLEWIEGAFTFSPEDQPAQVAAAIGAFAREPVAPAA